jgi:hypothetical protein
LLKDEIMRRNPMARINTRRPRRIDAERLLDLSQYSLALDRLNAVPATHANAAPLHTGNRFAFVALYELSLHG